MKRVFKNKTMLPVLMLSLAFIVSPSDDGSGGGGDTPYSPACYNTSEPASPNLDDDDDLVPNDLTGTPASSMIAPVSHDFDAFPFSSDPFGNDSFFDAEAAGTLRSPGCFVNTGLGSRQHSLEVNSPYSPAAASVSSVADTSTAEAASANSTLIVGSQHMFFDSCKATKVSANVGSFDITAGSIKDPEDLKKKLFKVIHKGKLQDINEILSRLHTLNFLSQNQNSPCHVAVINFKIGILKKFLATGYDLHPSDSINLLDFINERKREIELDDQNSKDIPVRHKVYHTTICKIEQLLLCDTGGLAGTNRFSYTTTQAKYRGVACVDTGKAKIFPIRIVARGGSAQAADSSSARAASVISANVGSVWAWQKCLFHNIKNRNVKDFSECLKQRPNNYTVGLAFLNEDGFSPLRLVCSSSNHSIKFLQKLLLSGLRLHKDDTRDLLAYVSNKMKHSKGGFSTIYKYERIHKLLKEDGRFTCTDELIAADSSGGAAAIVPKHPAKRSATAASSSAARPVASVQKAKRPKPKATKANSGSASGTNSDSEDDGEL